MAQNEGFLEGKRPKALRGIGNAAFMTAFPAYEYMTGQNSLGGAIGGSIGGLAGWELGSELMNKALPASNPYDRVRSEERIDRMLGKAGISEMPLIGRFARRTAEGAPSGIAKAMTGKWGHGAASVALSLLLSDIGSRAMRTVGDKLLPVRVRDDHDEHDTRYPMSIGGMR